MTAPPVVTPHPSSSSPLAPPVVRSTRSTQPSGCAGSARSRSECLEFALGTNQESGVWGGLTEEERRRLRKGAEATAQVG